MPVFRRKYSLRRVLNKTRKQVNPHPSSEEVGVVSEAAFVATPFKVLTRFKVALVALSVVGPLRFPLDDDNDDDDDDEGESNAAAAALAAGSAALAEAFAASTSVSSADAGFAVA